MSSLHYFRQSPPVLCNQYDGDRVLRTFLRRHLPAHLLSENADRLAHMGHLTADDLYRQQQHELHIEPRLIQWDAWGNRIDRIELTPLWHRCRYLSAETGLVATGYDPDLGRFGRLVQFSLVYLFHPSSDMYTCPLAMTDGAARALIESGNGELIDRAVPHLTSRDPDRFWTSGQWMTEAKGGSDVSGTETVAERDEDDAKLWRLTGKKWFTSAATSEMALTLARPKRGSELSASLDLFYIETRNNEGLFQGIRVLRLKDKLGTRKLPTAELELDGALARPVGGVDGGGVRRIAPMLNVTRTWNAVAAVSLMRRGIALARDYATRRTVRGRPLSEMPLHNLTLASVQAEFEAAFHLVFYQVLLMGRSEHGELDEEGTALLRLLTPLAKLLTGKQVVAMISECIESFGGAGYVEDTGLPLLLRDAQVLPIWEGTTNVLALDVLRVVQNDPLAFPAYCKTVDDLLIRAAHPTRNAILTRARDDFVRLEKVIAEATSVSSQIELNARHLAISMGRILAFALLSEAAADEMVRTGDTRSAIAASLFCEQGLYCQSVIDPIGARSLGIDVV